MVNHVQGYFQRLSRPLRLGLLAAFLIPLALMGFYFHFQFNLTLKKSGKLHLINLAESQRNTIDLFLQERIINIFNLLRIREVGPTPSQEEMDANLKHLREQSEAFVDVGFLDAGGIQVGYSGRFPFLQGRDYSKETWFQRLMERDRNYYISDIYLGFRDSPHFTIAVKHRFETALHIMRATMDPDKFYMFLRTIGDGKVGNSALINEEGRYQLVAPRQGELLACCPILPPVEKRADAIEIDTHEGSELVAYARLKEVPWILIIRQPLKIAYAEMYQVRWIMLTSISALVLLIVGVVWLTTGRVVRRAEALQASKSELQSQLIHATKLASVGELAAGVAHEINNPLAIITAETGVIRDLLNPEFELGCTPEKIIKELDYIDCAVFRASDITRQLLDFARRTEPRLEPCEVNRILDEVVGGLKEREFKVSNIELIREFGNDLPQILIDPDQIRQVFLNIINNAGDAIEGAGSITLSTAQDGEYVYVTITDTGGGMTRDQIDKIFLPFYTTKEVGKGTGLGLSISYGIVQAMGGRIEVQSLLGKGSSFTILLPVHRAEVQFNVE